jgi:hypothetical protein
MALRKAYGTFHEFIASLVADHRAAGAQRELPEAALAAWALIGLGTAVNVGRELDLLSAKARRQLLAQVGRQLLGG